MKTTLFGELARFFFLPLWFLLPFGFLIIVTQWGNMEVATNVTKYFSIAQLVIGGVLASFRALTWAKGERGNSLKEMKDSIFTKAW